MKILSLKVNEKNVSLLPIVRYKSATFNGQQCRFEPTKTKNNCHTNKTKNKGENTCIVFNYGDLSILYILLKLYLILNLFPTPLSKYFAITNCILYFVN